MTPTLSIYARQRTIPANTAANEAAIAAQLEACHAFAHAHGYTVGEEYVDVDAGTIDERPGFDALLASRPAAILTYDLDRLARLPQEFQRLLALDVPVYSVTPIACELVTKRGRELVTLTFGVTR